MLPTLVRPPQQSMCQNCNSCIIHYQTSNMDTTASRRIAIVGKHLESVPDASCSGANATDTLAQAPIADGELLYSHALPEKLSPVGDWQVHRWAKVFFLTRMAHMAFQPYSEVPVCAVKGYHIAREAHMSLSSSKRSYQYLIRQL